MSTISDWLSNKPSESDQLEIAKGRRATAFLAVLMVISLVSFMFGRVTATQWIDHARLEAFTAEIQAVAKSVRDHEHSAPSAAVQASSVHVYGSILKRYTNVRQRPSTDSPIVWTYDDPGELVEVIDRRGEWLRVQRGWIHVSLVDMP